jgi:hypothetical protein
MKQLYDITPPPELVKQWEEQFLERPKINGCFVQSYIATKAARWGADMELRACCDTLQRHAHWDLAVFELMDDRRPKPPSLKEQALEALGRFSANAHTTAHQMQNDFDLFRRVLEALDD